jgi:hypothetical protein
MTSKEGELAPVTTSCVSDDFAKSLGAASIDNPADATTMNRTEPQK